MYDEYDEEVQDAEAAEDAALSGMPKVEKEEELKPFIQSGSVQPFPLYCMSRAALCVSLFLSRVGGRRGSVKVEGSGGDDSGLSAMDMCRGCKNAEARVVSIRWTWAV